ncbi:MAG: cytochrome c-type biogenesis protein CcmH [Thermomicrobium sp.]|nr:cytochrome c-type biogenesis protein CcmH [Thermomicrobium sp.]
MRPERASLERCPGGPCAAKRVLVLLVAIACSLVASGTVASVRAEEPLSPEALEIANQLNCPVCQGQSVRDSNSELARQMRQLIQQKLDAGESRQAILDYFVQRYGVGVLREPPRQGYLWLLWWGPVIVLAVGAVVLVLYLRRHVRGPGETHPTAPPEELERLERVLGVEGDAR